MIEQMSPVVPRPTFVRRVRPDPLLLADVLEAWDPEAAGAEGIGPGFAGHPGKRHGTSGEMRRNMMGVPLETLPEPTTTWSDLGAAAQRQREENGRRWAEEEARMERQPGEDLDAWRKRVFRSPLRGEYPMHDQRALDLATFNAPIGLSKLAGSLLGTIGKTPRLSRQELFARALEKEQKAIGDAYDAVRAHPLGPEMDPLVKMSPEDMSEVFLARGPLKLRPDGTISVDGRGHGVGKIIVKHGELSTKDPSVQMTRRDVMEVPRVLREFEPYEVLGDPATSRYVRRYRVSLPDEQGNQRSVIYAVSRFTTRDGRDYVVTGHVEEGGAAGPMSAPKRRPPESPE